MSLGRDLVDIIRLGRFHFLVGGFLIYSLGSLLAMHFGAGQDLHRFLFGYLVFFPAHLSVSYSNDLYDIEADRHNVPSPFSGGSGVLLRRPELAPWAKRIALGLIASSLGLSLAFMIVYERTILFPMLVASGCFLSWSYTAPPIRFAYRRLGEVTIVTTVGLAVLFMGYFVMSGSSLSVILFFLFPQLLYGVEFLMNVQIPDLEADKEGGKTTMVVLYGRGFSFVLLFLSVLGATIFYGLIWLLRIEPVWKTMGLLALISLIPLLAALPAVILRPTQKAPATMMVTVSMASTFVFLIIADLYLLFSL